jgi:hypothetical protein
MSNVPSPDPENNPKLNPSPGGAGHAPEPAQANSQSHIARDFDKTMAASAFQELES